MSAVMYLGGVVTGVCESPNRKLGSAARPWPVTLYF